MSQRRAILSVVSMVLFPQEMSALTLSQDRSDWLRLNLRAEMRVDEDFNDHGFCRNVDGSRTASTTFMRLRVAEFGVSGDGGPRVSHQFRLNLADGVDPGQRVDRALLQWEINPYVALVAGVDAPLAGGWETLQSKRNQMFRSLLFSNPVISPFYEAGPQLSFLFYLGDAGTLRIQGFDDRLRKDIPDGMYDPQFNKSNEQPIFAAQYQGVEAAVVPVFQGATYDMNHSKVVSAGLKFHIASMEAFGNYVYDMREVRTGPETTGVRHFRLGTIYVDYTFTNALRPFLKVAAFDTREDGGSNVSYNPIISSSSEDSEMQALSDNGGALAVGVWFDTPGHRLQPVLSYITREGVFLEDPGNVQSLEKRRETTVRLGLSAVL